MSDEELRELEKYRAEVERQIVVRREKSAHWSGELKKVEGALEKVRGSRGLLGADVRALIAGQAFRKTLETRRDDCKRSADEAEKELQKALERLKMVMEEQEELLRKTDGPK